MGEKACGAWQILLNIQIEIALNGTNSMLLIFRWFLLAVVVVVVYIHLWLLFGFWWIGLK